MKTIGLLPVRNEAWILPHTLASLSEFCDVILVNDQNSEDSTRDICRGFSRVQLLESSRADVCETARWALLDAARDFEGSNLLWWVDADEMVSPALFQSFLDREGHRLAPGTVIASMFYHLWGQSGRFRDDGSLYAPHWKSVGIVDDRSTDFERTSTLPLHQPRIPEHEGQVTVRSEDLRVFHLQWLISDRNQMKQAWYRCREWLDGRSSAAINSRYSITFPAPRARTSAVPPEWVAGLTFPDEAAGAKISWQERDILEWFDSRGVEFFEPLEIWHIPKLAQMFRHRTGRRPKPDRSYIPPLSHRARHFARRVVRGTRRRLFP